MDFLNILHEFLSEEKMKRKYYGVVDGKLYDFIICDSCRTEDAGTFECLQGQVPKSLPYWCLMVNGNIEEKGVHENRNKICL